MRRSDYAVASSATELQTWSPQCRGSANGSVCGVGECRWLRAVEGFRYVERFWLVKLAAMTVLIGRRDRGLRSAI